MLVGCDRCRNLVSINLYTTEYAFVGSKEYWVVINMYYINICTASHHPMRTCVLSAPKKKTISTCQWHAAHTVTVVFFSCPLSCSRSDISLGSFTFSVICPLCAARRIRSSTPRAFSGFTSAILDTIYGSQTEPQQSTYIVHELQAQEFVVGYLFFFLLVPYNADRLDVMLGRLVKVRLNIPSLSFFLLRLCSRGSSPSTSRVATL